MSVRHAYLMAVFTLVATGTRAQQHVYDGTLDASDPTRPGGSSYDEYMFDVEADQIVTVRMQSSTFDTYLIVRSPAGVETVSDDFDGTMVSQVELVAPEPGRWVAWASSYSSGTQGAYTLSIRPRTSGQSRLVQGRLDRQDAQALKGEYFDTHTFESHSDGEVLIHLTSLGFDGFLVVTRPDGAVVRDGGASAESMQIGPLPAFRGVWRVDVTSESPGMVGAYDLRFVEYR